MRVFPLGGGALFSGRRKHRVCSALKKRGTLHQLRCRPFSPQAREIKFSLSTAFLGMAHASITTLPFESAKYSLDRNDLCHPAIA